MREWQLAQIALVRCCSIRSRIDTTVPCWPLSSGRPARSAAAAVAASRAGCRAPTGRAAPARSGSGYEVTIRMPRLAEQTAAAVVGQRHAAEVVAVDIRDAVVPRQPLVEERVVGGEQVDDAAVVADLAVDEELGLALHGVAQIVVEIGKGLGIGRSRADVPQQQPLPGEVLDERARARIVEHPRDLLVEHLRRRAACRAPPDRAVLRPGCCSTGRTTAARRARYR